MPSISQSIPTLINNAAIGLTTGIAGATAYVLGFRLLGCLAVIGGAIVFFANVLPH